LRVRRRPQPRALPTGATSPPFASGCLARGVGTVAIQRSSRAGYFGRPRPIIDRRLQPHGGNGRGFLSGLRRPASRAATARAVGVELEPSGFVVLNGRSLSLVPIECDGPLFPPTKFRAPCRAEWRAGMTAFGTRPPVRLRGMLWRSPFPSRAAPSTVYDRGGWGRGRRTTGRMT
jgi:hypothetical protein